MPIASAEFPEDTWKAMQELADIRGIKSPERFPQLLQDALRVLEWVLFQQGEKNRVIVALEPKDLEALQKDASLEKEQLAALVEADRRVAVRQYFAKAARPALTAK
jgi:hypothetical protein